MDNLCRDMQLLAGRATGDGTIYPRRERRATPDGAVYSPDPTALSWRRSVSGPVSSDELRYRHVILRLAGVALRHPGLIIPMLSAAWRFRSRDWFRRAPFLPLPPANYVEWRLHTAYGDAEAIPSAAELARYLEWTARMRKRERALPRR